MGTTTVLLCLALTSVGTASTELDPPRGVAKNRLQFAGAGGLSVGLPVFGWVGGRVRYDRLLGEQGYAGVLGDLSAGIGMISPRANAFIGYDLFGSRRVDWDFQLYVGWPLVGLHQRFEVRPLLFRHFELSLGEATSAELLWNFEAELFTRIAVPIGGWVPALKVSVEAGLGVRSAAHVGPSVELTLARHF